MMMRIKRSEEREKKKMKKKEKTIRMEETCRKKRKEKIKSPQRGKGDFQGGVGGPDPGTGPRPLNGSPEASVPRRDGWELLADREASWSAAFVW